MQDKNNIGRTQTYCTMISKKQQRSTTGSKQKKKNNLS